MLKELKKKFSRKISKTQTGRSIRSYFTSLTPLKIETAANTEKDTDKIETESRQNLKLNKNISLLLNLKLKIIRLFN